MDTAPAWKALFPDRDFRFNFGARPGDAAAFFAPTADCDALLAERAHWISAQPECCLLWQEDAGALIAEALACAESWCSLPQSSLPAASAAGTDKVRILGGAWEPDWLLLQPDAKGSFLLRAAAVCFPSSWRPEEKLGLPVWKIHSAVPTLNETLGAQIDRFLNAIEPGASWERANWGISASPERCQHPARHLPGLAAPLEERAVWVRVEHQVFYRLPGTGGLLFGIRLENIPLKAVMADAAARRGLCRALRTMPDEVARYKGLHEAREALCGLLSP